MINAVVGGALGLLIAGAVFGVMAYALGEGATWRERLRWWLRWPGRRG